MTKESSFAREHDAVIAAANEKLRVIKSETIDTLERLAVATFGAPDPDADTLFAPPNRAVPVKCSHCGATYMSSKMRLEYRPWMQQAAVNMLGTGGEALSPLWWCKDTDCDGAGFGFDIHEVKAKR